MARRARALVALLLAVAPAAAPAQPVERVPVRLEGGRTLEMQLRLPPGERPLPAVMLFGGFRGAAKVLDAVPTLVPIVAASFDYPFDPPRRFEFPGSFAHLPAMDRGIEQTFEGIRALTALLRAHPRVDPARITIVGASLGAPFAVISAADLDLPGLVIVHGFGDPRRVIAHQFIHKFEPRHGRWVRAPSWALATLLDWIFELPRPEQHAPRLSAQQRALMLVAADDTLIPTPATRALWDGLQASEAAVTRIDERGGHLRGIDDPRIGALVARALDWMAEAGLR